MLKVYFVCSSKRNTPLVLWKHYWCISSVPLTLPKNTEVTVEWFLQKVTVSVLMTHYIVPTYRYRFGKRWFGAMWTRLTNCRQWRLQILQMSKVTLDGGGSFEQWKKRKSERKGDPLKKRIFHRHEKVREEKNSRRKTVSGRPLTNFLFSLSILTKFSKRRLGVLWGP